MALSAKEKSERRAKLIEQKQEVTAKISDTTRFVAFGLLIVFYAIHTSSDEFAEGLRSNGLPLFVMGVSASVAILFDYLQYVCGLWSVDDALKRETADYDNRSWTYWGRKTAFEVKQYLVIAGAVLLVYLVGTTILV